MERADPREEASQRVSGADEERQVEDVAREERKDDGSRKG